METIKRVWSYCRKYKLFFIFIVVFLILLTVKILFEENLEKILIKPLNMSYNIFLGLSMSALFYYWIEYKRMYINLEKNKKKVLKMLKEIENMLEEVYYNKRNYKRKWNYYIDIFNHLEYIAEITYKFNWFETSYVESLMRIQIQGNYTYLKRNKHKILEMEEVGKKLFKNEGKGFDKKLSESIKFEEIRKDVMNNKSLRDKLCFSDEMEEKIEEVTRREIPERPNNPYCEYCEKEILIIQLLLIIIDDIRKIVGKLKI